MSTFHPRLGYIYRTRDVTSTLKRRPSCWYHVISVLYDTSDNPISVN